MLVKTEFFVNEYAKKLGMMTQYSFFVIELYLGSLFVWLK